MISVTKHFIRLVRPYTVSFGTIDGLEVIQVEIERDGCRGRGECCPMAIYGQDVPSTIAEIEAFAPRIASGELDRLALLEAMPAGPGRNAIDCALWDWEAKRSGTSVWDLAGIDPIAAVPADVSIGIQSLEDTARDLERFRNTPTIKLKLGSALDIEVVRLARQMLPDTRIFVDVNGAWTLEQLKANAPELERQDIFMIEQPLARGAANDLSLDDYDQGVALCADESCHTRADFDRLAGRYDFVNLKLDKTGGLTEALLAAREAKERGFRLMVGCMLGSDLALAPAYVLATQCEVVDLDLPFNVNDSQMAGMRHDGRQLHTFGPSLWG